MPAAAVSSAAAAAAATTTTTPTLSATEWVLTRPPLFWWLALVSAALFYHFVWQTRVRVWPLRRRYLPAEALVVLSQYKYKSGMSSWLDVHVFNPLWTWTADRFVPDWAAPNAITITSLAHAAATTGALLYCGPALAGVAPWWVYAAGVWNMWMYQLLDALDGKQARRMDASSPLGQLFDHGCDALCCVMSALIVASVLQTGASWTTVVLFLVHVVPFFVSNWEEVQTGVMRFGVLGITEAQLLVMALLAGNALFGPALWQHPVGALVPAAVRDALPPAGGWAAHLATVPVYYVLVVVALAGVAFSLVDAHREVTAFQRRHGIDPAAGHWQLGQFVALCALGGAWCWATRDTVFGANPVLPLVGVGVGFAYLVSRLIVHKTTHAPFARCHEILWPLPCVVLNAVWRRAGWPVPVSAAACGWCGPWDDTAVAWAYTLWAAVVYLHFVTSAIREITSFLNIRVFHLPPPEVRAAKKAAREAAAAAAAALAAAEAQAVAAAAAAVAVTNGSAVPVAVASPIPPPKSQ